MNRSRSHGAWMALTCCVTCGASSDVRPTRLATKVPGEQAWNTQCEGSLVSAPSLSESADNACAVLAAPEESALAMRDDTGETAGYAKHPLCIAKIFQQRRLTPELSRAAKRRRLERIVRRVRHEADVWRIESRQGEREEAPRMFRNHTKIFHAA